MTLSLDRLRRIQRTLMRRVLPRDPTNIQSVGFAPLTAAKRLPGSLPQTTLPVVAQFDVLHKRVHVADAKRIARMESLRLLDRSAGGFEHLVLATDVEPVAPIVPTGVRIRAASDHAVSSLVIRWTTVRPPPPAPQSEAAAEDPRWRWGVLTVSHLFAGSDGSGATAAVRVQRNATCGDGPLAVGGRVVARGRIPGGPDVGLVETGLDRLWLSGFLPRGGLQEVAPLTQRDLLRWVSDGTSGHFFAEHSRLPWRWKTFYPSLHIDGLGRLKNVVRYEFAGDANAGDKQHPFGPGTSGGVLVAGGIPVGLQVAAMRPRYHSGFAQTFDSSLPWLTKRLRASSLSPVRVITEI